MSTIAHFDPPGGLTDFTGISGQADAWDEFIGLAFQRNIEDIESEIGQHKSQFYNPKETSTDAPIATDVIRWKGFPLLIAAKHPGNKRAAFVEAEQLTNKFPDGRTFPFAFRPQDEYLEWRVTRDSHNKVVRVTFTCEGPEYWEALANGYPADFTRPLSQGGLGGTKHTAAQGSLQKLLDLYHQFVSPDVKQADLLDASGRYNRFNRWNTTDGIMHLCQPNNTLGAEINIAAQATILRKNAAGHLITGANELIRCSRFGDPNRASDPHIGDEVNRLARDGASITLLNPVGLFMDGLPEGIDTWTTPNHKPASQFWKVVRGTSALTLRAVFEVPASEGFTVQDIKIGGQAIEFGGQIAEHINMKLTGIACRQGQSHNAQFGCPGEAQAIAPPPPHLLQGVAGQAPDSLQADILVPQGVPAIDRPSRLNAPILD